MTVFPFVNEKDLKHSDEASRKGSESGLLYVAVTVKGVRLAHLSIEDKAFDDVPNVLLFAGRDFPAEKGYYLLKQRGICSALIDEGYFAKPKVGAEGIDDCTYCTFIVSDLPPEISKAIGHGLLEGYLTVYCPRLSDVKTLRRFSDSNGINPQNYSNAAISAISLDYSKRTVEEMENERKRRAY